MSNTEHTGLRVLVVDISLLWRRHWHAAGSEEVSHATQKTVGSVRRVAGDYDRVVLAMDCPPYKRKAAHPSYKEGREPLSGAGKEQFRQTVKALEEEGYLSLGAEGHEADDAAATVVKWTEDNGHSAILLTSDKDFLQLVDHCVTVLSPVTWDTLGHKDVVAKTGVPPQWIPSFLALVGDRADNVAGVKGCGAKTAAKLIMEHGATDGVCLDGVHAAVCKGDAFSPALQANLERGFSGWPDGGDVAVALDLVTLRTDLPIDCDAILAEQHPVKTNPEERTKWETEEMRHIDESAVFDDDDAEPSAPALPAEAFAAAPEPPPGEPQATAMVLRGPGSQSTVVRTLEPTSLGQAFRLSQSIFESRLFPKFANPEAVLAVVLLGKAHGLDSIPACCAMNVIKGSPTMSAGMMVGLVKGSPQCDYFMLVESTDERATFETKRHDNPGPTRMTYTMEQAKTAGLSGGNYSKNPDDMLRARASSKLARAEYQDVLLGAAYTEEELGQ